MVKRRYPQAPIGQVDPIAGGSLDVSESSPIDVTTTEDILGLTVKEENKFIFKDPAFQHTSKLTNKKRAWRSLKQIVTQERSLPWGEFVHYSSIDAPPSFKPAKKYSDISGLSAKYTDPQTKLYYAMADEFSTVRSLPMDITAGYLALRRANNPVG